LAGLMGSERQMQNWQYWLWKRIIKNEDLFKSKYFIMCTHWNLSCRL